MVHIGVIISLLLVLFFFFFFNDTATTEIYTLSLHDALPIFLTGLQSDDHGFGQTGVLLAALLDRPHATIIMQIEVRSEEHTSELQSQSNLVCRLLLEKKKRFKRCSVA